MKNNKGFTLIEIMIVVAIIGILALVLVPRIGGMKDSAKLAGLDTNLRVAEGMIQGIINDYPATATGVDDLETALASRLAAGGANAVKNPLTDATGATVGTVAANGVTNGNAAFVILTDDTENAAPTALATSANLKGVIYVAAYQVGGALKVEMTPYDQDGVAMGGAKVKTIVK